MHTGLGLMHQILGQGTIKNKLAAMAVDEHNVERMYIAALLTAFMSALVCSLIVEHGPLGLSRSFHPETSCPWRGQVFAMDSLFTVNVRIPPTRL
jgi:hypothetical protein